MLCRSPLRRSPLRRPHVPLAWSSATPVRAGGWMQLFNPMGLALINPLDRGLRTLEVTNFRN